ncbi:MAG TPA: serine/threonine-protein kinase, partial [Polyangiaceae bacterium]|nr:serine/threonine-protein kinase [Polyangiaceae bacterium]
LPLGMAVRIVSSVAAGLHAAHELIGPDGTALRVVHRDVSPQNILVSTKGNVTVTDFGVAKAAGQAHRPTETGEMKGKLSYMAPEQVKSKDIDHRVDIFALGCVLYQATLGQRPFHGGDALATMYKLLEERVVPPTELDPDYPPELEAIVLRALAKDRNERYQTAEEFHEALEKWLVTTRTLVTASDVANYLMEHLGERVRERNARIFRVLRNQESAPALDEIDAPRSGSVSATVSGTARVVRQDRSSRFARVAGVGAAVALGAALVALWAGKPDSADVVVTPTIPPAKEAAAPKPGAEQPATAPVAPPAPEAAKLVSLSVAVTPSDAEILLNGKLVGVGTITRSITASDEPQRLEVRADDYISQTQDIIFDRTQALTISLQKAKRSTSGRLVPAAPRKPNVEAPAPQSGGSVLDAPPRRPPRSLDGDNPFGSKE